MAPATVLVVDDDPVILKLLEVNFEMEGFEVIRASDGAEGLERAREALPDIVVLDVMMPRMTGYEVAKALREDVGTAHIPIIFVTARAQSSDVERGMELGVDDYVTKPFDPLDLIARVNTLLARRESLADGNGEAAPPPEPAGSTGGQPLVADPPAAAPVAEPPVAEPPVAEPPVAEPPVAEPPVTEPPVTESAGGSPPDAGSSAPGSPVTEPPAASPGAGSSPGGAGGSPAVDPPPSRPI